VPGGSDDPHSFIDVQEPPELLEPLATTWWQQHIVEHWWLLKHCPAPEEEEDEDEAIPPPVPVIRVLVVLVVPDDEDEGLHVPAPSHVPIEHAVLLGCGWYVQLVPSQLPEGT
jgi:hypothetical protein